MVELSFYITNLVEEPVSPIAIQSKLYPRKVSGSMTISNRKNVPLLDRLGQKEVPFSNSFSSFFLVLRLSKERLI
jgi:hypothetical protein